MTTMNEKGVQRAAWDEAITELQSRQFVVGLLGAWRIVFTDAYDAEHTIDVLNTGKLQFNGKQFDDVADIMAQGTGE